MTDGHCIILIIQPSLALIVELYLKFIIMCKVIVN